MKKFLLTLAAVALASSALMAQTNVPTPVQEEPDRVQMKALSRNPSGIDIATGMDKNQDVKHECKDHKDGQACNKPADQQCPDCKAKAAAKQGECKKAEGKQCDKAAGMNHECKKAEGKQCDKAAGMKHECKKAEGKQCDKAAGMKHDCKKAEGKQCDKAAGMKQDCKKAEGKQCDKAAGMKQDCKKAEGKQCDKAAGMKHECKDHKDGQACNKPADQQCPDCKAKAAAKKN